MVGDFYGTGTEIWAGFGLVGITEKKYLGQFFHVFMGKKIKEIKTKNIVVSALKRCMK